MQWKAALRSLKLLDQSCRQIKNFLYEYRKIGKGANGSPEFNWWPPTPMDSVTSRVTITWQSCDSLPINKGASVILLTRQKNIIRYLCQNKTDAHWLWKLNLGLLKNSYVLLISLHSLDEGGLRCHTIGMLCLYEETLRLSLLVFFGFNCL